MYNYIMKYSAVILSPQQYVTIVSNRVQELKSGHPTYLSKANKEKLLPLIKNEPDSEGIVATEELIANLLPYRVSVDGEQVDLRQHTIILPKTTRFISKLK